MRTIVIVLFSLLLSASPSMAKHRMDGGVSWYNLPGQTMANGKMFNPHRISVAHKTLPLGTNVCITNLDNGHTVRNIPVTDRGPYIKGREWDASPPLAIALGFKHAGTANAHGWVC